jgi:hypothetical protein
MGPRATSQCAHALRRRWAHLCVSECCLVQNDCFIQREQVTFYKNNKCTGMFNFIDIYLFIRASGCVGIGTSLLLSPGPMMLLRRPWISRA